MKKLIIALMAFVSLTGTCLSQDKIPTSVMSAFNSKFPNAINVKWDKENEHEYEASFEWESKKLSANYSDTGEWLETESTILFSQLPLKVQTAFNRAHNGVNVKAVAIIETFKGQTKFEIEFRKGAKMVELFYLADGTETR